MTLAQYGNSLFYNAMTNVLTFLQSDLRFKAFSFNRETKNFTEIILPEEVATIAPYRYAWGLLSISPDGNLMTKCYQSAQYQTAMFVYINASYDGKLKAYDNDSFGYRPNSLTGFLTGNVDEEGRVEVEVMAPQKVNLSIEVLPDPQVFEIKGDVL